MGIVTGPMVAMQPIPNVLSMVTDWYVGPK